MTGRCRGVTWMLREGLQLYGKALVQLRRSLASWNVVQKESLIATVKLLSLFEVPNPGYIPNNFLLTLKPYRYYTSRLIPALLIEFKTGTNTILASLHYSSLEHRRRM